MRPDRPVATAAVLYSRRGCPLCFALGRTARRAARRHGVPLRVLDVDADPELRGRYGNGVPVLEMPGGRTFQGRAAAAEVEEAFREAAAALRATGPAMAGARGGARWLARLLGTWRHPPEGRS